MIERNGNGKRGKGKGKEREREEKGEITKITFQEEFYGLLPYFVQLGLHPCWNQLEGQRLSVQLSIAPQ